MLDSTSTCTTRVQIVTALRMVKSIKNVMIKDNVIVRITLMA